MMNSLLRNNSIVLIFRLYTYSFCTRTAWKQELPAGVPGDGRHRPFTVHL